VHNSGHKIIALTSPDGSEHSRRDEAAPAVLGSEASTQVASPELVASSTNYEPGIETFDEGDLNGATGRPVRRLTVHAAKAVGTDQQSSTDLISPKLETASDDIQKQIDDAVDAKFKKWREARRKERPWAVTNVAEEFEVRRRLVEVECAERGISRPSVVLIQVQTLESFLDRSFQPKEDLITGLLNRRDMVALVGRRRHGKTTFVANLALSVTLPHTNFLGYTITKPLKVLILYLEDDAGEVQIRLKRMSKGELPGERLALYTREDFLQAKIPISGTNPQFQKFVIDVCAAHRPDIIILDNLAHLVGADYNSSTRIHELSQFLFRLTADFNAAVIVAAHPRKRDKKGNGTALPRDDQEGFFEETMGSSHFVNSCGSLWGIERDLANDHTDFLGGTQRFNGQQNLMTLDKDDDDWLRVLSNLEVNLPLALNSPGRIKAWELLPDEPFSYTEGERAVKSALKSSSSFHGWLQHCLRLGLIIRDGDHYRKAAGTQSGIVEVSS
jgi:hypothetical protein